jgi:hypothetical protein
MLAGSLVVPTSHVVGKADSTVTVYASYRAQHERLGQRRRDRRRERARTPGVRSKGRSDGRDKRGRSFHEGPRMAGTKQIETKHPTEAAGQPRDSPARRGWRCEGSVEPFDGRSGQE